MTTIGRRLAATRQAAGLSQYELARRAGLVQSIISMIEAGKRPNPGIATLGKIAAALGVTVDALIAEQEAA